MPKSLTMIKNSKIIAVVIILILTGVLFFIKNNQGILPAQNKDKVVSQASPVPLQKINLVLTSSISNQIPVVIAFKKGLFSKYNLDANIQLVPKNSIQALASGGGDAIIITPVLALSAAVEGVNLSWVGTVNNNNNWVVASSKDPQKITSMAVLSGLDKLNSMGLLKLLNLDVDKITFEEVADTPSKLMTLKEKKIDSVGVAKTDWLIYKRKANLSDDYKLILDSTSNFEAALPVVIVMRSDFLNSNKDASLNFAKAMIEADAFIKNENNNEELIKLMTEYYPDLAREDVQVYLQMYQTTLGGLDFMPNQQKGEELLKQLANINSKAKDYDIKNFVTTEIYNNLKGSGFIEQFKF